MVQKIIRTFRLFINEDTAVHDLIRTISGCIKNSDPDHAQKSADFFSIMSSKVVQFKHAQEQDFHSMSRQDQNIRIFTALSATISGMNMHAPLDHTLVRLKMLLWFELTELHDKIFYQQQEFPQTCVSTTIHPIHYVQKQKQKK